MHAGNGNSLCFGAAGDNLLSTGVADRDRITSALHSPCVGVDGPVLAQRRAGVAAAVASGKIGDEDQYLIHPVSGRIFGFLPAKTDWAKLCHPGLQVATER